MPGQQLENMGFADLRTFRETVKGSVRPAVYSTTYFAIAASGSNQDNIIIDSGNAFVVHFITGVVLSQPTGNQQLFTIEPQPDLRLQFTASGGYINDREDRWDTIVGTSEYPHKLATPITLRPAETVTVIVNNLGAVAKFVMLSLGGFRVYTH